MSHTLGVPELFRDKLREIYEMLVCIEYPLYPPIIERIQPLLLTIEQIAGLSTTTMVAPFATPELITTRLETLHLSITGSQYPLVDAVPEDYITLLDDILTKGALCESLYAYTEVDPNSHINISTMCIVPYSCWNNENAFLYKDAGAGYFENFTHKMKTICTSLDENGSFFIWFLTNQDAKNAKAHFDAGNPCIGLRFIKAGPDLWDLNIQLFAIDGIGSMVHDETPGGSPTSPPFAIAFNTEYWVEITRFNDLVTCNIYDSEDMLVPIDQLQITIPNWVVNPPWIFRYIYVCQTWNDGNAFDGVGINGPIFPKITPCG